MSILLRLFAALTIALPVAVSAQSDETGQAAVANGQRIGAWTVSCRAVAVGQTDCTLTQRIVRAADNAFVADVIATRNEEGATFLVARVPTGAFLPDAFALRDAEAEDAEALMEFSWQSCGRDLCETLLELEPEMVTTLSADDNAMVAAFRPSSRMEPFVFQLSLSGMEAGLDTIRP